MKKIVTLFCTAVFAIVLLSSSAYSSASSLNQTEYETRKEQLLSMTPQECYEFLASNDVYMPDYFDIEFWGTQGMYYVQYTIDDPNYMKITNDAVLFGFSLGVSSAVNHYLGIPSPQDESLAALKKSYKVTFDLDTINASMPEEYSTQSAEEQFPLIDSELYSSWDPNFSYYNCYSYAINRPEFGFLYPAGISMINDGVFWHYLVPVQAAYAIKDDLRVLYYDCVAISIFPPPYYQMSAGQNCIAFRVSPDDPSTAEYDPDFHFMKYDGSIWTHKPGRTRVLRYKYSPDYKFWSNEAVDQYTYYPPSIYYTSDIYYIYYKTTHRFQHIYTGNNYHAGSFHYYEYADICADCYMTYNAMYTRVSCSGPPCMDIINAEIADMTK